MAIVRWDPFKGLDNMFEEGLPQLNFGLNLPSDLSVDVYEEGDNVIAEMHLAGMDPEKFDVTVEDNYLRVTGSKEDTKEDKKKNYYYKEIRRGSFERTIRLPDNVSSKDPKATYEKGVLKVILKKENIEREHKKIVVEVK